MRTGATPDRRTGAQAHQRMAHTQASAPHLKEQVPGTGRRPWDVHTVQQLDAGHGEAGVHGQAQVHRRGNHPRPQRHRPGITRFVSCRNLHDSSHNNTESSAWLSFFGRVL